MYPPNLLYVCVIGMCRIASSKFALEFRMPRVLQAVLRPEFCWFMLTFALQLTLFLCCTDIHLVGISAFM